MIKKPTSFQPDNIDNIQPSVKNEKSMQSSSSASKLDDVLSSSLLDIGNNGTTWSSSVVSSNPKVAVGPIMSSWTAFSESPVDIQQYQPFCSAKQESAPVSADWSMDFALPHDLLSNAADSDETSPKNKLQKVFKKYNFGAVLVTSPPAEEPCCNRFFRIFFRRKNPTQISTPKTFPN